MAKLLKRHAPLPTRASPCKNLQTALALRGGFVRVALSMGVAPVTGKFILGRSTAGYALRPPGVVYEQEYGEQCED